MGEQNFIKGEIQGLRELTLTLDSLGLKLKNRTMRTAITKAVRIVAAAAKQNAKRVADVRSGQLWRSIGQKVTTSKNGNATVGIVGPRKGFAAMFQMPDFKTKDGRVIKGKKIKVDPTKYAHLVEGGTKPHRVGNWNHPGAKPKPFLRPAWDANKTAVETLIMVEIDKALREAGQAGLGGIRGGSLAA